MQLASRLGVGVVATFIGQDPRLNVEENIPAYRELFSRYCDLAHKLDLRIAIENCPMINVVTMKRNNIAYSPEVWDVMFDAIPSENLGIDSIRPISSGSRSTMCRQ